MRGDLSGEAVIKEAVDVANFAMMIADTTYAMTDEEFKTLEREIEIPDRT